MSLASGVLLFKHDATITCPSCASEFSLDRGFAAKALEQLTESSAQAIAAMRDAERLEVEKRAQQLVDIQARAAREEIETFKKLLDDQGKAHTAILSEVRARSGESAAAQVADLRKALDSRQVEIDAFRQREAALDEREREVESRVATAAQAIAGELMAIERQSFGQRLAEKSTQVAALREEQLQLRKEREQLKDERAALALQVQKQVDTLLQQRESLVRAQEQQRGQLERAELQKKLDDAGEQLAAAQRKMEQGSQQLQGEVLELAIEEGLRRAFPMDTLEEVKKGQRGGDVLQHVVTRTGQPAGTILWETKRAKDWSVQWIVKLKEDMRACGAAVGILVTMPGALPKEWPGSAYFALHEDIWVTQPSCAVGIAEALRSGLIDVHRQRIVSAGKGEKMEAMYDYLTSPQFASKLKAVYETFKRMRDELDQEKSVTMQRWARREKQLQAGMHQLLSIGGEIQGLAQQDLPMLELESEAESDKPAAGK